MRILADLTQPPRPAYRPRVHTVIVREAYDISPGALLTDAQAAERDLRRADTPAPDPLPRPRRPILPQDQGQEHPLWLIVDRTTDQVQARVRGDAKHVVREARIIALQQNCEVADLRIVMGN